MRISIAILAALLCAAPAQARTLDMSDEATASLLRAYLSNLPPDFEEMALRTDAVRQASEFDRAAVLVSEIDRLRRDYTGMADVDGIVLRLSDSLGEYDAAAAGFPLRTFGPDIYVPLGGTKIVFDNYRDFAAWKLPVAEAKSVLSQTERLGRTVDLELTVRPFAVSRDRDGALRTQVRSVRITSGGKVIGTMTTEAPDAPMQRAGDVAASAITDERLDMLGLGSVDKVSDPQSDGCHENEAEKAVCGLVVSRGQPPTVFQL
ncbi:hypothetical protein Sa4125_15350 [Aureimonas sp. SA4125]|nr:hypothetical protein Sa4125_15350 [Aureimonas sp. SA4125]